MVNRKPNTVVRVIDIKSWSSEVAREHRIESIPQLWLYDGEKLVSKDPQRVLQWLSQ